MNRVKHLFDKKDRDILNVYFTAGHPQLDDTVDIIRQLSHEGVDLVEVGMPYSDPLADGKTIQNSSQKALENGMKLDILFAQIKEAREYTNIPIILMGYYNQMIQYGEAAFLEKAKEVGVDGMIIPDLPMEIYVQAYRNLFEELGLTISFLITPETSEERIRQADKLSSGFIYVVSKSSITGTSGAISGEQEEYFNRLEAMNLDSPTLIGFGIYDQSGYNTACRHANGAIIGSAFIRALESDGKLSDKIVSFLSGIR